MCGILVYPNTKKISHEFVREMLRHRGPDASSMQVINGIVFFHCLLQIRGELKISIQPRFTKSKRYLILFNGQIYNTKYLDSYVEVEDKDLDTNYLLELIDKFGVNGLKYIDGMYGIVIYDLKLDNIYLARDPSGQKPLYYSSNNQEIFISSEIYPIIKILNNEKKISRSGAMEYFMMGYNSGNKTIYDKIFKLLPGEIIEYSCLKKKITKKFFLEKILDNINEDITETIKKNINNHFISKKKIALNLSGGIDSNLILYEAIKFGLNPEVFSTYCVSQNNEFNKDYYSAKKIAKKFNLKFHTTTIDKKIFFENIQEANEILEEPSRNSGNTIYFINYKSQRQKNFKSIISGSGGDEIFIGYPDFFLTRKYQKLLNISNKIYETDFLTKLIILSISDFEKYKLPDKNFSKSLLSLSSEIKSNYLQNILNYRKVFYPKKSYSSLNFLKLISMQYGWLSNESFLSHDKLSMNNSIETRAPFASQEFRNKILEKTEERHFLSNVNKPLIRTAYKKLLDAIILNNTKKSGWPIPQEWLFSEKFNGMVLDLMPKNDDLIKWTSLRKTIEDKKFKKENIQKLYSIFSFLCIKNKFKLSF